MAKIVTLICDVKDCGRMLQRNLGSEVEIEIKTPPHWTAAAVTYPHLCDVHLAELMAWLDTRKIELTLDV